MIVAICYGSWQFHKRKVAKWVWADGRGERGYEGPPRLMQTMSGLSCSGGRKVQDQVPGESELFPDDKSSTGVGAAARSTSSG